MPHRVLCVSASMGAGHDGAAREMVRRLEEAGHEVELRDFLDSAPFKLGAALKGVYEFLIRYVPWSYEATYRVWFVLPFLCPPVALIISWLTRRRIGAWARQFDADIVVSTYPLATVALGELRRKDILQVPVVNFITDFGVHPLWVHPAVDLNLATHPKPAAEAARRTGQPAVATGPLVSPRFFAPQDRATNRAALDLAPGARGVLIVAGSWGVGAIAKTAGIVAASGRYVPIVVCGRDERLRRRLTAAGYGCVIGWTDQMPALMSAADALIENAGGLTSMEALASGLPVVTFGAIAGHGRENTTSMQSVGVSRVADDAAGLLAVLDEVTVPGPARQAMTAAGRAMFVSDASLEVIAMADAAAIPDTVEEVLGAAGRGRRAQRAPSVWLTRAAGLAAAVPLAWAGLSVGVGVAAANGLGVAHPAPNTNNVAYLAVRVNAQELQDPAVVAAMRQLNATAVVDGRTARLDPAGLRRLTALGIQVANGGTGVRSDPEAPPLPWARARADVVQSGRLLRAIGGEPPRLFVPLRRINGFDLLACRSAHALAVVPSSIISVASTDQDGPAALHARGVYLVDGTGSSAPRLLAAIDAWAARLHAANLVTAPLAGFR